MRLGESVNLVPPRRSYSPWQWDQTRFNAVPRSLEVCPGEVGGVGQFGTSAKVVQSLAVGPHFDSLAVKMSTDDGKTAGQAPLLEGAIPALERLESLIATTNAAQVIVLQNVLPKLEHLEKVLAADRAERMTTLKDFGASSGWRTMRRWRDWRNSPKKKH